MKGLALLAVAAQLLTPQSSENLIRGNLHLVETEALQEATLPVQQWLGRKLYVYESGDLPPVTALTVFPSKLESGEAIITPTAVFLPKSKFLEFRSGFELAEFLSHAAAHVRLDHAQKLTEKETQARLLGASHGNSYTVDLEKVRKEMEAEAQQLAAQILETADCGPGPCAMFGRLLAAARR